MSGWVAWFIVKGLFSPDIDNPLGTLDQVVNVSLDGGISPVDANAWIDPAGIQPQAPLGAHHILCKSVA